MRTGVIILCHGSRGKQAITEIPQMMQGITRRVKPLLTGGAEVVWAAMQFNHPDLFEAAQSLTKNGIQRIVIMPYFLFSGRHITSDIPEMVIGLKKEYPDIQFTITSPLGMENTFLDYITRKIKTTVPELSPDGKAQPRIPDDIERQSMEIIERLLPGVLMLSESEKVIVKRIVHATGDVQIARQVRFHPEAIESGLSAIRTAKPVYTDVRMVEAGINKRDIQRFGCSVHCALAEMGDTGLKMEKNKTRSAAAFLNIGEGLKGTIVSIGNAPTALLALVELIDKGISPSLVIGMPVGFVQARESKAELTRRDIPYITIAGRRGGSPAAAATVNALLRLASETTR